ncbi:hypothetical protein CCACVL1_21331 [Corchorus capsularis]|uniref:Uncharacterized protein n=1 Tax=Corchorus capsularis TaxID=210143 RepID=A0A1R3H6K8_COCAP|nr:hypothetical protein CCACVL1_21331 [Corchorus capsularis]
MEAFDEAIAPKWRHLMKQATQNGGV